MYKYSFNIFFYFLLIKIYFIRLFNNSKERNIGGNSDWKLREALELPVSDKGKSGLRLKPDGGNLRN